MTAVAAAPRPPLWRRLVGFNLLAGVVLGVGGWYVGWFGAHAIHGMSIAYFSDTDYNELSVFLAYLGGVVGFLIGLGFLNYPVRRLLGYPPSLREKETAGAGRYFNSNSTNSMTVVPVFFTALVCPASCQMKSPAYGAMPRSADPGTNSASTPPWT